jgi:hypothetical protein
MRYMFIVTGSENLAGSGPPPAALFEVIEKYIGEAANSGKLVSFGGLKPTATGARMRLVNGTSSRPTGRLPRRRE